MKGWKYLLTAYLGHIKKFIQQRATWLPLSCSSLAASWSLGKTEHAPEHYIIISLTDHLIILHKPNHWLRGTESNLSTLICSLDVVHTVLPEVQYSKIRCKRDDRPKAAVASQFLHRDWDLDRLRPYHDRRCLTTGKGHFRVSNTQSLKDRVALPKNKIPSATYTSWSALVSIRISFRHPCIYQCTLMT